jgi:hypothetical protein
MRPYTETQREYSSKSLKSAFIVNKAYKGNVWKLRWLADKRGPAVTHFRITGPYTDGRKGFMPYRYSDENFSLWLGGAPMFIGGTVKTVQFIGAYQDPKDLSNTLDVNKYPTPATVFIDVVKRMAREFPEWDRLMKGGRGRGSAVPSRLKVHGLVQGIMLRSGDSDFYSTPDFPALLLLTPTAVNALITELCIENPNYVGRQDDFAAKYVHGDIIDADKGKIICWSNDNADSGTNHPTSVNWGGKPSLVQDSKEFTGYTCTVGQSLAMPRDASGALASDLFTPWENVLSIPSEEEMIEFLCRAYEDIPQVITTALKQYYHKLPKYIKDEPIVNMGAGRAEVPTSVGPQGIVENPVTSATQSIGAAQVDWTRKNAVRVREDVDDTAEVSNPVATAVAANAGIPAVTAPQAGSSSPGAAEIAAALSKLQNMKVK